MATSSSMETESNHQIQLSVKECPVTKVTVYKDRAEVCRTVETAVKAGVNEVKLVDLVEVDEDSIRVEGKGEATIAEVSFQTKYVQKEETTMSEKCKELSDQLKELRDEQRRLGLVSKSELVSKQWGILNQFAETASKCGQGDRKEGSQGPQLDESYFKGMRDFMQHYKDLGSQLEAEKSDIEKMKEDLEKKIDVVQKNIREVNRKQNNRTANRECVIVLEAEKETKVTLQVSYVVFHASWFPSYDLRMSTQQGTLTIFYYGLISNGSGEDWANVKLHLSTAEPSVGGSIPVLPISQLSLYTPRAYMAGPSYALKKKGVGMFKSSATSSVLMDNHELYSAMPQADMCYAESTVTENVISANYEIARISTIPSDNTEHKVTVAVLEFSPHNTYVTVPRMVPHAFLQAHVTNTSAYTLLAGRTNIFLDNSFVAKADLKSVAPKEEFVCSLGMDPGVRVVYKPLIKVNSTTGLLSKWESIAYEQAIEVRNMHDYQVEVLVKDHLPLSTSEKIKVNLLEPQVSEKNPVKGIRHFKATSHLEWDLTIPQMGKAEVVLKYSVEHPRDKQIETNLVHPTD